MCKGNLLVFPSPSGGGFLTEPQGMTQSTDGKLERVNVRLWKHDLEYLKTHYPANYNDQVRRIVGMWIIHARRKAAPKEQPRAETES